MHGTELLTARKPTILINQNVQWIKNCLLTDI